MLTNYHTHTFRCQHANGTVEDYVREAIAKGFDILGMSDHVPYPHYEFGYRMPMAEIWIRVRSRLLLPLKDGIHSRMGKGTAMHRERPIQRISL